MLPVTIPVATIVTTPVGIFHRSIASVPTTPASDITEASERSIPPPTITTACPIDRISRGAIWLARLAAFAAEAKRGSARLVPTLIRRIRAGSANSLARRVMNRVGWTNWPPVCSDIALLFRGFGGGTRHGAENIDNDIGLVCEARVSIGADDLAVMNRMDCVAQRDG